MVIIENVPAAVQDHQGVVGASISLLKEVGDYIEFDTLYASDMDWPQTRKRYFIVASQQANPISIDAMSAVWRGKICFQFGGQSLISREARNAFHGPASDIERNERKLS